MTTKKADSGMSFWLITGILAAIVFVGALALLYFSGGDSTRFFSWLPIFGGKNQTPIETIELFRYDLTKDKIQYYDGTTFSDFNQGETLMLNNKQIKSDTLKSDIVNWYFKGREKIMSLPKTYTLKEFYGLIKNTSGNRLPQEDIDYLTGESINEMWCAGLGTTLSTPSSDDGVSLFGKNILFSLQGPFTEPTNYPNYIYLNGKKTNVYITSELIKIKDENLGEKTLGYLEKINCKYTIKLSDSQRESINSAFGGDKNYFDALNTAIIKETRIILPKSVSAAAIEENEKKIDKNELNIAKVKIYETNIGGIKDMMINLIDDRSNEEIINAGYFMLKLNNDFYFDYTIKTSKKSIKILYDGIECISNIYNEAKEWRNSMLNTKPIQITIFQPSPDVNVESPIYVCPQIKDNRYIVVDLAKKINEEKPWEKVCQ